MKKKKKQPPSKNLSQKGGSLPFSEKKSRFIPVPLWAGHIQPSGQKLSFVPIEQGLQNSAALGYYLFPHINFNNGINSMAKINHERTMNVVSVDRA